MNKQECDYDKKNQKQQREKKSLIFINLRVCLSVVAVVDLIKLIFYDKKKKKNKK